MQKAISFALVLALAVNLLFFPISSISEEKLDPNCFDGNTKYVASERGQYLSTRCARGYVTKRTPAWSKVSSLYKKDFTVFVLQVMGTGIVFAGIAYVIYRNPNKEESNNAE